MASTTGSPAPASRSTSSTLTAVATCVDGEGTRCSWQGRGRALLALLAPAAAQAFPRAVPLEMRHSAVGGATRRREHALGPAEAATEQGPGRRQAGRIPGQAGQAPHPGRPPAAARSAARRAAPPPQGSRPAAAPGPGSSAAEAGGRGSAQSAEPAPAAKPARREALRLIKVLDQCCSASWSRSFSTAPLHWCASPAHSPHAPVAWKTMPPGLERLHSSVPSVAAAYLMCWFRKRGPLWTPMLHAALTWRAPPAPAGGEGEANLAPFRSKLLCALDVM